VILNYHNNFYSTAGEDIRVFNDLFYEYYTFCCSFRENTQSFALKVRRWRENAFICAGRRSVARGAPSTGISA